MVSKVIRVEKPDEKQQIKELKERIKELEIALGKTQAKKILGDSFLKLACREFGSDVESFKKKVISPPFTIPSKNQENQ